MFDLVSEVGPVEAMRLMRAGETAGTVSVLAEARRRQDRAAGDLAEGRRIGARLVTPEDREWPDEALRAMQVAYDRERPDRRRAGSAEGHGRADTAAGAVGTRRTQGGRRVRPGCLRWSARAAPPRTVDRRRLRSRTRRSAGTGRSVSGGAFGIDAAAHRGALAGAGLTVAIVAGGLLQPYPRAHESLFARIGRDGLIVSEFPPDATPQRHRFLVRNRLVAGLAAGVVVVEAGLRSGSLATARQALRMGRVVMGGPGPVTSHESAGVHQLLRSEPEAMLVTRPVEVIEAVGAFGDDLADRQQAPPDPRDRLEPLARQVLDGLPVVGVASADRIAVTCGVPALDVLRCLPALELTGFVEATPAGWQLTPAARTPHRP